MKDERFPHGKPADHNLLHPPVIIVCINEGHRKMVQRAFPINGGMYILPGSAIAGVRTDKIVIFKPEVMTQLFREWTAQLRCRLSASKVGEYYIL